MSWWWSVLLTIVTIVTAPISFIWRILIWHPSKWVWIPISLYYLISSITDYTRWDQQRRLFNFIFAISMLVVKPGWPGISIATFLSHFLATRLRILRKELDIVENIPEFNDTWLSRFIIKYMDRHWPYTALYIAPGIALHTSSLSLFISPTSSLYRTTVYTLLYISAAVVLYRRKKKSLIYFAAGRVVSPKKNIDIKKSILMHIQPETVPKRTPPLISSILKATSYYEILGVPPDASDIAIKKAMKTMSLKVHPDKIGQDIPGANAASARVTVAARELLDPVKRKQIDDKITRMAEIEAGIPDYVMCMCHCGKTHAGYLVDINPSAARWCVECNKHHPVELNTTWMHTERGYIFHSYFFYTFDGKGVYDITEIAKCTGILKVLNDRDGTVYEDPHGPGLFGNNNNNSSGGGDVYEDELFDMLYRGTGGNGNKMRGHQQAHHSHHHNNNKKKKKSRHG